MSEPPKGGGGATDYKSPKPPPRRPKTPDSTRQVHFESDGKTGSRKNIQQGVFKDGVFKEIEASTVFPQVGTAPGGNLQWHTSANPTLSVRHPQAPGSSPFQPQAYTAGVGIPGAGAGAFPPSAIHPAGSSFFPQLHHHHQLHPQPQHHCAAAALPAPGVSFAPPTLSPAATPAPGVTYIGLHQQPHPVALPNMAADYQNAAPPPSGVHFQPPVPDTTFGPIPHVYVPRYDGGLVSAVQQPAIAQPLQGSYVVHQQPYVVHPPPLGQPPVVVSAAPPAFAPPSVQHVAGVPAVGISGGVATMSGGIPVYAGNTQAHLHAVGLAHQSHIPEVSGLGRTAAEEQLRQVKFAYANRLFEPQDFKPADDDPSRFYFVREVDGNWTQRNRFTIDNMGDCRWYVTDEGWFYAVRLPD